MVASSPTYLDVLATLALCALQPLFDKHHGGIKIDGHMPLQVVHALQLLEYAMRVAEAALHYKPPEEVAFEDLVSRARGVAVCSQGR